MTRSLRLRVYLYILATLLRFAFATAPHCLLNLACKDNSPVHSTKGTLSPINGLELVNIIIESLETLTVIDVNSGKNRSRREEALFAINVEAAKEIARQLRLRNISGMILVDFINLKKKEQQQKLISVIREELQKDSVPANFIDITRLGLVELTRKKVYKSLREILS